MKTPIIDGLNQNGLESYLNARQYEALYWPTFFPVKPVNRLDASTLIGAEGNRVAAHVISYDAKAPEATRKSMSTVHFDIPKIAVKRIKTEKEILEHQTTKALQGQNAVIEDYFNDVDFVFDSAQARMEWFALQALSLTKIQLSSSNNPQGIVNETVIDFGMDDANKKTVSVIWSTDNVATMDPIKDFKAVVKAARALGIKFQKMLMTSDTYDLMTAATKFKAYFNIPALSVYAPMSLDTINTLFKSYDLPEIVLVDTYLGIEGKDGTITQTNPWSTTHITFIPQVQLGNMFNAPIAEEIEKPLDVLQAKKGNVLISLKKDFDPVRVVTKGECNVFPSWPSVDKCFSLYTAHASTWA